MGDTSGQMVDDKEKPELKIDTPIFTHALWTPACLHRATKKKIVMFMRSGERFDRVFGEKWKISNMKNGRLFRTDANMPLEIKALKYSDLENDSPITPYGRFVCATVANGIRNRRLVPERIVCGPSLRTVQSAGAVADVFQSKVHVDDNLCEPLAWYKDDQPKYLTHRQLAYCGFPIADSGSSDRKDETSERLYESFRNETEAEGLARIQQTLRGYLTQSREGPLLVVGHAITLAIAMKIVHESQTEADVGAKSDSKKKAPQESIAKCQPTDHLELGVKFPYSCLLATTQENEPNEELLAYELPNLIPSFTASRTLSNEIDLRL